MDETLLSTQKIKRAEILEAAIASTPLEIQPIIGYPRELAVNKTYLVTIDILSSSTDISWGYPDEEYSVYCRVRGSSGLSVESIDEPFVVLHRFGGTYGPARFYLKAEKAISSPALSITLLNNGMPLHSFEINDIKVVEKAQTDQIVGKQQVTATETSDRKLVQEPQVDTSKHTTTAKNINKSIEADYKYDVFISYSHKDEEWVRNVLLPTLEKRGLKVCIDFRDFKAGKPAIKNMRDGILESRHTLLVLTEAYLKSGWTEFESLISQTLDPANQKGRVIPMLKEKCNPSLEISNLTYINFYNPDDWDISWKQLLEALGSSVTPPPVPVDRRWFFGHRYGDIENFTGRTAELKMLTDWLDNDKDNLLILRALGGFGKSILTWQWFNNNVDKQKWRTAVWWSFYEKESGFESFLSETLKHLGVEVKESARQQVNDLLEAMRGTNILIVLDGFERLLRQYGRMDAALQSDDEDADIDPSQRDCSSPLTETFLRGLSGAGMKSKVLMTTRLCPRALESADGKLLKGCRDEALSAFSSDDAVTYFHNEGIAGTRSEILAACSAYGYHPLSLSLLVGLINENKEHRGDIEAVKNLEIFEDVRARRHHVLERAYESLAPERRDLLSKISCFRGSMEYAVLKKVFPSPDLDKALLDLRKRGLLQYAGETQRYDMHPIVRHYIYNHFTDEKRRNEVHVQLAQHFVDAMPVTDKNVKALEDLAPIIELYHHMVRAGNLDEAMDLFYKRINKPAYYQFGAYQLQIELLRALFLDGEDKPPRLKDESAQAWALNMLANVYSLSGQPRRAIPLFEMQIDLQEKAGNKKNLAIELESVASVALLPIGVLSAAERNLRHQIDLCHEIADEFSEAVGHQELGRVLSYRGAWQEAEQELDKSLELAKKENHVQMQGATWLYRALRFLLMAREKMIFDTRKSNDESRISNKDYRISSIQCVQRALELANEMTQIQYSVPRDYVRAYWLLGAAYCANNELTLAEENLSKALNLCRQINLVEAEADILLNLARLHYAQGDFKDAQEKASEALMITERSGYVLQGADVNLFLAQYALEQEKDKAKAKAYAESALKLAYCDGPPYYYKVAYEEAERFLENLK